MDDILRIGVQWLHVLAGVVWIGAGFYVTFVQLPALASMPLAARGPALMALGPRQVFYILRAAEVTIASGVANLLLSGRARQLEDVFGSRWALVMTAGIVLALVLYGLARGLTKPLVERLLAVAPRAAGGDAAAAAQVPVLRGRIQRLGIIQITIGTVILLAMVAARFS